MSISLMVHLSQTLVGLPGQLLGVPPGGDALESVTLGDANNVHHLVLGEHGGDGDLLLKVIPGEGDLVSDGASVELDLHDVGLLLPENIYYEKENYENQKISVTIQ